MKELYTSPKAEVIEFDAKDIIATSGLESEFKADGVDNSNGWGSFI